MRNPGGYIEITSADGYKREADTFTCSSCNKIVVVEPMMRAEDLGGICPHTSKLICSSCVGNSTPFEEKLKAIEARGAALRSYGL